MKLEQLCSQLLCPPGFGVFTVHTAAENKKKLSTMLYNCQEQSKVEQRWQESLCKIKTTDHLILGLCSDTGGGIHRGANWGPLMLREYLYASWQSPQWLDWGDIRVIPHLLHDKYLNDQTIENCRKALYGDNKVKLPVCALSMAEFLLHQLWREYPKKKLLTLGGDHSVSYSLAKPYIEHKKQKVGILHFDAHTDLLDSRLGIDICFASWTYHILDLLDNPQQVVQIGLRSSGKDRNHWESTCGVRQFWAQEVLNQGVETVAKKIVEHFKGLKVESLYISVDIDCLDIEYASATGTPESQGLSPFVVCSLIRIIGKEFKVGASDLVEVAPFINPAQYDHRMVGSYTTLQSAISIIHSLIETMEETS